MADTPQAQGGPSATGDVIELRVHGVSGASAGQVLDRPHTHQVAGDRSGGFHRPRPGYPDTRGAGGVVLEAYRWSDLPSGTAVRTLSLVFLLPFMLCNVALWMRPAGSVDRRLRDPWDVVVPPSDTVAPPVVGHWPGESDPRFGDAVRDLTERLRRGSPPGSGQDGSQRSR